MVEISQCLLWPDFYPVGYIKANFKNTIDLYLYMLLYTTVHI